MPTTLVVAKEERRMRARQIMTRRVLSVTPEHTVLAAANLMLRHHVSGLPVLDGSGAVVGVVSEGDFLRRDEIGTPRTRNRLLRLLCGRGAAAEDYVREHGRRVSEIMTLHPVTINEDAPLSEIVSVMEQNHIKRLPVVRDGKLVGIVSRSNLLQAVAGVAGLVPHP